jgi:diadenosine tetraphosphate (Ap4A) HIT family hydrolase
MTNDDTHKDCVFCQPRLAGEITCAGQCVIVDAQESLFPGFTRVIWHDHVREMTDLTSEQRQDFMAVVFDVEQIMRATLKPHKVNLASLGNQTPHLHWHVIPRFEDDVAFPGPVWVSGIDSVAAEHRREQTASALADYHEALIQRFTA